MEIASFDREHVWHPYAPVPAPVPQHVVTGASGVRIALADGRELVDGMSSWWSAIHGYRHPRLDRAIGDQLGAMAHVMFGGLTHAPAVELARTLTAMTGLPKVFFADSGSVAVEVAIKMALQYGRASGRTRLMTVRGGYHGDTFGAMAVCDPVNGMHHMFASVLPEHVFAGEPPAHLSEAYLAELESTVARHSAELAAIIVEPVVQGAGGMRFYHPGYLRRLRELADEHGILLIADEIATGFGRTGELFGCDHAGVRPDIMCLGKALTGGYLSLAATLCTERVAEGVGVLMHGPTFMANPLATAVARASLELLAERPWREEVKGIEAGLSEGLAGARGLPGVRDVRVLGAIGVIETEAPVDVPEVQRTVMAHGVWLRPFGRLIYTMPPYPIGADDLALITRAMVAAAQAL
ncbi:adenosylmethionine-8-amino-7-oxononanoate aminotransferase [Thermocatellispora tengchongensis]|uniref:Adenosylmethionine-8-amino-7-oxononanoate aminotransferase n=1 Tax=Thermocatellispora tengchongensis TaxID=1073253 RepID=A0A840NPM4_9ACTN|nr:adenosylmethionine--8-amino-7-oxononanoate transaminase [Thermocatellispora tengchongensis]MBB5130474.1 adenosylmethionine-8-amino-7-oxononanoate aminotransferase [Thermocatellispora tengchongensis]